MKQFNLEEINPNVSRVKINIAYSGKNRRKFDISKEVFDKMKDTLKGTPILAFYIPKIDDIGGHEGDIFQSEKGLLKTGEPIPYGFVCPMTEPWWELSTLPDGQTKESLFTYAYLWKQRYPRVCEIIENSGQSMEISIQEASMINGFLTPMKSQFIGLCALGNNVSPTFENSKFEKFSFDETFVSDCNEMYTSISEVVGFSDMKPSQKRKTRTKKQKEVLTGETVKSTEPTDKHIEQTNVEDKNFTEKGEIYLMEQQIIKDLYTKFGMDKYIFTKETENEMFALDLENMKPVKMGCGKQEGMSVPDMESVEDSAENMDEEDMLRVIKVLHDMYMAKHHGYMSLEAEKETSVKEAEEFKASLTEKDTEIERLNSEITQFSLLKKQIEAKEILNHADFSILNDEDKKSLVDKMELSMDMDTFKLHAEAFSFKKMKDMPATKVEENTIEKPVETFSMDLVVDKTKDDTSDKPKDLYAEIKKQYNFV